MEDILVRAIEGSAADYVDARYESFTSTAIACNNGDIEGASSSSFEGGVVRTIAGNGIAFASFDDLDGARKAVGEAEHCAAASTAAGNIPQGLAPAPVVRTEVRPRPLKDPRKVTFDEKRDLLLRYAKAALDVPGVFQARLAYHEGMRHEWFVNSEGSRIHQEILICYVSGRIFAKDGDQVEYVASGVGFAPDFARLEGRDEVFVSAAKVASQLTKAPHAPSGTYKVVTDPSLGGVFIHEAFGHLSETDTQVYNAPIRKMMQLGKRLGGEHLQVFDWADLQDAPGSYYYDHEGVQARKTTIIKDGVLVGKLYSRHSGFHLGGEPTGNYRARDYRYLPLIRQSNICIGGGSTPVGEMISSVKDGLYLCGARGGQTMGDFFTFGCEYGYRIRDGKVGELVRGTNISGNLERTMADIAAVGNDFTIIEGGGCGRSRAGFFNIQLLDKSGRASPHVLIDNLVVGGGQ